MSNMDSLDGKKSKKELGVAGSIVAGLTVVPVSIVAGYVLGNAFWDAVEEQKSPDSPNAKIETSIAGLPQFSNDCLIALDSTMADARVAFIDPNNAVVSEGICYNDDGVNFIRCERNANAVACEVSKNLALEQ